MKAYAVSQFGQNPALIEVPKPSAKDEFVVRVTVAGANPIDYKLVDGLKPDSPFPFVMGLDFAGVLESIPEGEQEFKVGDRVFGMATTHGADAEYTSLSRGDKSSPFSRIPDALTDEQAAALPVPAITVLACVEILAIGSGERIVILGATGGVGGYALQIARARGAHVIASVRGNPDAARALGADEVYDSEAGDVIDAVRTAHPEGVDAVLDLVSSKDEIPRTAEILKPSGKLVSTIHSADENWFAKRNIQATNYQGFESPLMSPDGLDQVAQLMVDGTITARIGATFRLNQAAEMIDKLRTGGVHGKAVLLI